MVVRRSARSSAPAWAVVALIGLSGVPGTAEAQPVTDSFKAEAIEALNAAASAQPAPAAPTMAQPTPAVPKPLPTQPAPTAPTAAPAQPQPAAPPAAPLAEGGRLSDTLPLKPEPERPVEVGQDASSGVSLTGLALASLLLGAAALLAWWLQKRTTAKRLGGGVDTSIEVLSSARIAGRYQISLVRVPGAILVLGVSDKGLTLLTELSPEAVGGPVLPAMTQQTQTPPAREPRHRTSPDVDAVRPSARRTEPSAPTAGTRDSNEFLEQLLRAEQQQQQQQQQQAQAPGRAPDQGAVEGEQLDIRRRLQRYQQGGMGME